jgi:glutamate-ammonia-ligase adenylyltransferase
MRDLAFLEASGRLPRPADASAASLRHERWRESVAASAAPDLTAFADGLDKSPAGQHLLEALFGNSPFLTECVLAEPDFLRRTIEQGPDATIDGVLAEIARLGVTEADNAALGRRLRLARRRIALGTAMADICGLWTLDRVTGVLSDFAEAALRAAAAHLLTRAAAAGAFELPDLDNPEKGSGLVVLGMGKLGGKELNYSSDIDLVVFYDPERIRSRNPDGLQAHFIRLARGMVQLLEERTADGYVFRTDLRLRPDPGATPLAISTQAAEIYYETLGQNWERAAMIKARPVAGDAEAAAACQDWLQPFIWRKHLDFAAIQDIHSIKRQIHAYRGGSAIALEGHNVKLGRGGIREIEFFVQTQQLIWGGREPSLRYPTTLGALQALVDFGRVKPEAADELAAAYRFLRNVEHRLQMVSDEQTHSLPKDGAGLQAFGVFMGYRGRDDFAADLLRHLQNVEAHYADLFEDSPSLGAQGRVEGSLVFTGADSDPETLKTLSALGFQNPEVVDATVRGWHHGRHRAMRSARARELLTELMPVLLQALASTSSPDQTFLRFDRFLQQLPAGVQLFSLFHANPQLLTLVAEVIGEAPRLADHLSHRSSLLDTVLSGDFFDPPPGVDRLRDELARQLVRSKDSEAVLDAVRRWAHDRIFQAGIQTLRGLLGPDDAGYAFSNIAEAAIYHLLDPVEREFARHHGRVPGGAIAVVAMGKLGGREMTPTSDLDLIFIYAYSETAEVSDGKRPLAPSLYYARLSQRLINAVTAETGEGALYEVDMRLRPSGNAGPIASSLEAFVRYHDEQAWTWEHMALTRARAIAGPTALRERAEAIIGDVLRRRRDPDKLLVDVADMRARIDKEFHTDVLWEVKYLRGGLVDVEFIVQYLQLRHGHEHPDILVPNTREALKAMHRSGLLPGTTADRLGNALNLWHAVQNLLRLTLEGAVTEERESEMSPGLKAALCAAAGAVDFADLKSRIRATAGAVYEDFQALIDSPARRAQEQPIADGSRD